MLGKYIRYNGYIYTTASFARAASSPSWSLLWEAIQDDKAFESEFEHVLSYRLDKYSEDDPREVEDELLDELKQEYYAYYENLETSLKSLEGSPCWRAVALPKGADPTKMQDLGVYWAFDKKDALPAWAYLQEQAQDTIALFTGKIVVQHLDLVDTFRANLLPSTREGGSELRFKPGSPIWIYDVTLYPADELDMFDLKNPIERHKVSAWRRC